MKKSLISIIVPVYEVEKYLNTCIKSLVHQEYGNLEIILIDDGSKDKCSALCDEWARRDKRIRVFHTENYGVSHARNIGLDNATGEFISFVDPDDWCDVNMYSDMYSYIKSNKADIHVGGYIREYFDKSKIDLSVGKPCNFSSQQAIHEMFSVVTIPRFTWSLCDKLISHELIENTRFNQNLKLSEDQWFLWQLLKKAKRISYAPQLAYHYRMRKGSATHTLLRRENGTYLDVMQRIIEDSQDMDKETRHILKMKYWQIGIGLFKDIIISNNHNFDDILIEEQKKLRKRFFSCLTEPGLSKLGVLYFSLPYKLVWNLRPILRKLKNGSIITN